MPLRDRSGPGVCRAYADRLATTADRADRDVLGDLDLRRHVRVCAACRRRVGEYRRLSEAVRSARPQALALLERDRTRLRRLGWTERFGRPRSALASWLSFRRVLGRRGLG